nr:VP2 [rabbit kobuvirus]
SPNVEELGYSDRILQLTMGNSSITTQECANAVVAYSHWPSKSKGMGEAIDKSTEPGPAASRFYTLDSHEWTAGGFSGVAFRFPECIQNLGMFGQNIHYHYLYRCGYLVHVQVNASKFHAGALLVVAIPECETTGSMAAVYNINDQWLLDNPISQLTVYPHQIINVRSNNSATLILPYVSPNPMENAAAHNPWTVAVIPIVHLNYATGASPSVPITLTVAPMECQFNGLRSSAVFQ